MSRKKGRQSQKESKDSYTRDDFLRETYEKMIRFNMHTTGIKSLDIEIYAWSKLRKDK